MQGRQLDRVLLLLIAALKHRHQGNVLHQVKQAHAVCFGFTLKPPHQLQDILPTTLSGLLVKHVVQVALVLDRSKQVIKNHASGLCRLDGLPSRCVPSPKLNPDNKLAKMAQRLKLTGIQTRLKPHLKNSFKQ